MRKLLLCLLVLVPLALSGCGASLGNTDGMNNVQFAQTVFNALATGNQGVKEYIDWDIFRAGGSNFGNQYQAAKSESEKSGLKTGYVWGFGLTAGSTSNWVNWGQVSEDANWVMVTANNAKNPRAVFTFTLSKRDGKRRLAAIDPPTPQPAPTFNWQPQQPR